MSQATVDVAIEIANELDVPMGLVASRRQIEARELGGGYVNNWCTATFAAYVKAQDVRGRVVLERDHGGPWQGNLARERDFGVVEAMTAAKASYKADIAAGFDLLHIDPSKGPAGTQADLATFTERTIDLIDYCVETASACGRASPPAFEIGSDEGALATSAPEELEEMYLRVREHCENSGIARPAFLALPTGTIIRERRNIGTLDARIAQYGDIDAAGPLARLLAFARAQGVLVKQHSADYLSDTTLAWVANSPIAAINVAPQLGVTETLCFMEILRERGHTRLLDELIALAVASGQWERWLLPTSPADDLERAIIAGHYVVTLKALPDAKHLHERAADLLAAGGEVLDYRLRDAVRREITRQLRLLSAAKSDKTTPAARAGETT
jgi:tagatose-1,6-bisphosphate aldolase non-catalytic subunit AgaZ/GatZ